MMFMGLVKQLVFFFSLGVRNLVMTQLKKKTKKKQKKKKKSEDFEEHKLNKKHTRACTQPHTRINIHVRLRR